MFVSLFTEQVTGGNNQYIMGSHKTPRFGLQHDYSTRYSTCRNHEQSSPWLRSKQSKEEPKLVILPYIESSDYVSYI
jgi:hypothetical protein